MAAWTAPGRGDPSGRGPLVIALSSDGGKTSAPDRIPRMTATPARAFIDIAVDESGAFHLVWLDSRLGSGKALMYARLVDSGQTWSKNVVLDAEAGDCCWNTIVTRLAVVCLVFRDLSRATGARASDDGGRSWASAGGRRELWMGVRRLPHVGGGLAFAGERVHAVVWTGKIRAGRTILLRPTVAPRGRATPTRRLRAGTALGHRCLRRRPSPRSGTPTAIRATQSSPRSRATADSRGKCRGALSGTAVTATHPRAFPSGQGFRAAWTEQAERENRQ